MKIINVVGARPNFMKIAPLIEEMEKHKEIKPMLVHTGQHYDYNMSKLFFEQLQLPKPDIYLGVGGGSHAQQTAKIMLDFEKILLAEKPDLVLVVGDVNSTLACSLTAVKLNIRVAHVEAGLRSFDRTMPEEINRIVTDSISDYLFTTEKSAAQNLAKEGIPKNKIFFVGNVMIDTLLKHKQRASKSEILSTLGIEKYVTSTNSRKKNPFALVTLHRPSNVDSKSKLNIILEALNEIQKKITIICPIHPRTMNNFKKFGFLKKYKFLFDKAYDDDNFGVRLIKPLGYLDFLKLLSEAKVVLTDSGGIQEETTVLGIPCLTLRENTERPITITEGTNILVGSQKNRIIREALRILKQSKKYTIIPEKWDGFASKRIVQILLR